VISSGEQGVLEGVVETLSGMQWIMLH